ncbi:hypothetical protein HPB50_011669 [Hyalomma asiaticum]|uniref:Uncharacterized protein n=1 Tax=Hyalomma asiaticum TaxID=266040 RepID=A0ACB7TGA0_HYAAI|nr:hypothetical protein HPB50_011669 [Hyalomma asiaticum]
MDRVLLQRWKTMKAEAPNKALSHNPTWHRSTQAYDVLAQPPEVAHGLGGDPGPSHAPDPEDRVNPQTSTSPRSRLELSSGPAQSRDLKR